MKISQHTVRDVFDFSSVGLHLYLTFIWKKKKKIQVLAGVVAQDEFRVDIMPIATALKRLLKFSGFRCCRSTEEMLCSVAGLKCMERLKSKIGWGIQTQNDAEEFGDVFPEEEKQRSWTSLKELLLTTVQQRVFLTFWQECHHFPYIQNVKWTCLMSVRPFSPTYQRLPPRGQDWQDMLSLQCVLGLPPGSLAR